MKIEDLDEQDIELLDTALAQLTIQYRSNVDNAKLSGDDESEEEFTEALQQAERLRSKVSNNLRND